MGIYFDMSVGMEVYVVRIRIVIKKKHHHSMVLFYVHLTRHRFITVLGRRLGKISNILVGSLSYWAAYIVEQ